VFAVSAPDDCEPDKPVQSVAPFERTRHAAALFDDHTMSVAVL
jgi:hypothetical protein